MEAPRFSTHAKALGLSNPARSPVKAMAEYQGKNGILLLHSEVRVVEDLVANLHNSFVTVEE